MSATGLPRNLVTNRIYQGINILNLWCIQNKRHFSSNEWATFKQWRDEGAHVKKREKGTSVVFYKTLLKEEENNKGEIKEQKIPMLTTLYRL